MSDEFDHLTDEDYEVIGAIVEGSLRRRQGEDILAAIDASDKARQQQHPLLEALSRAYEARENPRGGDDAA